MDYVKIILSKLIIYLQKKKVKLSRGTVKTLKCPKCGNTANIIPNVYEINCFVCKPKQNLNRYWNLIDVVKIIEKDKEKWDDNKILQYLKGYLDIKVNTELDNKKIENDLVNYEKWEWDLVPIRAGGKVPFEKKDWTITPHKKLHEWEIWLKEGLNIGVKTGKLSKITVIDIDALNKKEKAEIRTTNITKKRLEELMKIRHDRLVKVYLEIGDNIGDPLIQENLGGLHLIYQYEEEIPKTYINIKDIHLDIENNGGYILLTPSVVGKNDFRKFRKIKTPPKMSKEFKDLIISKTKYTPKSQEEKIKEDIASENFKIDPKQFDLKNNQLDGCCNTEFIKLGGILRKKLNLDDTKYVLYTLNKHMLENPMQPRVISSMVRELDKYIDFDEKQLAQKIIDYLKDVEEAGRIEIAMAVVGTNRGEEKKRIDKTLKYLIKEKRIIKNNKTYEIIDESEWSDEFMNTGVSIDFIMPYFYDTMYFNMGDILLIGASPAVGKTHISMNIIKQLVKQGIKPYYISLEGGSRWAKIAKALGLKDGDFWIKETSNPNKIKLKDNQVTIIDWICPRSYAETDKILQDLNDKVRDTKGVLIIFVQLRAESNMWFAPDLIKQFPAFACRYIYEQEGNGEYGKFHVDKLRDAKIKIKNYKIPCRYDWSSKEFKRVDSLEEKEKETG